MLEYTLEWAKQHKIHKVVLTVFSENVIAKKLYKKYAFVIEGIQKDPLYVDNQFQDEIYVAYFLN
ncbi:GNAT family N-acetyltransferase [Anaerobacillus alkalilacustris]|uniref:GNAT family N-acetyltransferase n=1 Tax=Anaerobacillus alkalilacustris TaxID=393763 RepID=UPI001FDF2A9C|nr:GNAT family protein [Anaerobacillus alkalilacustris]